MQRSTDRILTTHSGSLCRPLPLLKLMKEVEANHEPRQRSLEEDDLDAAVTTAVKDIVAEQVSIGVDIPSDGEMGRMGFFRYMPHRIRGFELRELEAGEALPNGPTEFPEYMERHNKIHRTMYMHPEVDISDLPNVYGNFELFRVTGPVSYVGQNAIKKETTG
jgi:5-methyltetrahydropteroyltriglutamate--homocysteine methyltransferase